MRLIADTESLAAFCESLATARFVTVDTEFMRERTYWPMLCLVQLGGPDEAAAIDAQAPDIDLTPLFDLMRNEAVLKVFHAARQDLEIFYHRMGGLPKPVFDTQIAAMVCGFGEQAAYDTLCARLAKAQIDKSSRFTDWSARPLSERQLHYAIADVTHLRVVYEKLETRLKRSGRAEWLTEEMAVLTDPATYRADPEEAWRRLKPRGAKPRMLAVLREVAAWREREAQRVDIPRQRMLRDESILEIAAHAPRNVDDLARTRGLSRGMAEGRQGQAILEAVQRGLDVPDADLPPRETQDDMRGKAPPATVDLLRILLKLKCEQEGVAAKLVASAADLERLAAGDRSVPTLHGWRAEMFGRHATRLLSGQIGIAFRRGALVLVDLPQAPS